MGVAVFRRGHARRAQLSVPMCNEIHEVELRRCAEASREASLPNPEEVGGKAQASVSRAHGAVVVPHHCDGRVKALLIHRSGSSLGSTEVGIAMPAVDEGNQWSWAGVNKSVTAAPGRELGMGPVDAMDHSVVADGQCVDPTDVALDQGGRRWCVCGRGGCRSVGSGSWRLRPAGRWTYQGRGEEGRWTD